MKTKNAIHFKTSNVIFLGKKMDINGNGKFVFQFDGETRSFSIPTGTIWNKWWRISKKVKDFFDDNSITQEEFERRSNKFFQDRTAYKKRLIIYK